MISRRDVVTAGVLGTLTGTAFEADASETSQELDAQSRAALTGMRDNLQRINTVLEAGLRGPNLAPGILSDIRVRYTQHLRSAGKFPDFMEIGSGVFYDVYDWHVRHNQQIQITRISDQRFSIQWMFTQLIVRSEVEPNFLGVPFDRG